MEPYRAVAEECEKVQSYATAAGACKPRHAWQSRAQKSHDDDGYVTAETRALRRDIALECGDITIATMKSLLAALMLGASALSHAADLSEPLILVAKPELREGAYRSTVLVVRPLDGDRHLGFIVNRPSDVKVRELFPEHGPSQKIVDPVYVGGPVDSDAIFALVERRHSPGAGSFEVLPGLYAAFATPTVDRIIEKEADRARFVAGLVAWREGELEDELRKGAWYVLDADAGLAMRPPEGLWEELAQRLFVRENGI